MADIQNVFKRYEKKFVLNKSEYEVIRQALSSHITMDSYGRHTICNIYYDTDDFDLIRTSIEKPVYKEKLRMRSYGVPGEKDKVFLEIKKKYKGVVYKRRVSMTLRDMNIYMSTGIKPKGDSQILREIDWFKTIHDVSPKTFLAYDRQAFVGNDDPNVRITFDQDIRWRANDLDISMGDYGAPVDDPSQTIMEIKIPGTTPLWLCHILTEQKITSTAYSKYGTCYKNHLLKEFSTKLNQKIGVSACASSILTDGITLSALLICTATAVILGLGAAGIYMFKNAYTKSFVMTMSLLPAVVSVVIMLVNGNIGTGVAVAGAFSLVRFRSVPGGAREITCIFFAMALGLACGMGFIGVAIISFVIIGGCILVMSAVNFGQEKAEEKQLKITIPEDLDFEGVFDDIFEKHTKKADLFKVKTTNMGTLYELHYHIVLKDKAISKEFLDALRCRNGNLNIVCGKVPSGDGL